jgi:hypothetical protein
MKKIAAALLAATALVALPAASAEPTDPKANCAGNCTVTITIPAGCGSGIRVSIDPITVPKAPHSTTITWTIATPNWRFGPRGIDIHGISTYARAAFDAKPEVSTATTYKIRHINSQSATYKYDINLVDPQGVACKLDPVIVDW